MNPERVKDLVYRTLSKRIQSSSNKYILCIIDDELKIIGSTSQQKSDVIIALLTELQIINGFATVQWDSMAGTIMDYCKEKNLCLIDLIP